MAKKQYFKELFDSLSNSVKQLWNNLNQVASLSKHSIANNVQKLLLNNYFTEDNKTISNYFNEYFCNVGVNLQKEFKPDQSTDFNGYMCGM